MISLTDFSPGSLIFDLVIEKNRIFVNQLSGFLKIKFFEKFEKLSFEFSFEFKIRPRSKNLIRVQKCDNEVLSHYRHQSA